MQMTNQTIFGEFTSAQHFYFTKELLHILITCHYLLIDCRRNVALKTCISRLPENGYGANVSTWPTRLNNPPERLQTINIEAYTSRKELYRAESRYAEEIVGYYVKLMHWKEIGIRNVLDMRAGFGG